VFPRSLSSMSLTLALVSVIAGCGPSRIVYEHRDVLGGQRDLYLVREDGANRVVLAASPDDETACGVTSDRRIVFNRKTSGYLGQIWLVKEDGTGLELSRDIGGPCFGVTGNDRVIAVDAPSIVSFPADPHKAGGGVLFRPGSGASAMPVAIARDNHVVVNEENRAQALHTLWSVSDDGTKRFSLAQVQGVGLESPFIAVSPHNRVIFRVPGNYPSGGLFSRATTGGPVTPLTFPKCAFTYPVLKQNDRFCGFTPDGRVLQTRLCSIKVGSEEHLMGDIFLMNDDGANIVQIKHSPNELVNQVCLGAIEGVTKDEKGKDITVEWVIVGRYSDMDLDQKRPMSVWSYPISSAGPGARMLGGISGGSGQTRLTFEGLTPSGRVLLKYRSQTGDSIVSVKPADAIPKVTLEFQFPPAQFDYSVTGFTLSDNVIFSKRAIAPAPSAAVTSLQVIASEGLLASQGYTSMQPLADQPVENALSFVFFTDYLHPGFRLGARRCQACELPKWRR